MNLTGEYRSTPRKTCPNATLSTTNPKYTEQGSNPGLRGSREEQIKFGESLLPLGSETVVARLL